MLFPNSADSRLTYSGDVLNPAITKAVMDVFNDSVPFVNCDLALLFSRTLFCHAVADSEINSSRQQVFAVTLWF
jgi:hypothetical protein